MAKPVISITEALFLESLEMFRMYLLPAMNKDRISSGFPEYTEQEIIDLYLDLRLENNTKSDDEN